MPKPRKLTDKQRKESAINSVKKWKSKHKDKVNYYQYKSKAVNFINKKSTEEDLISLKKLIDNKLLELKNNSNDIG
ncbi:hypothetical protein CBG04_11585 [Limosilactobacillus reuteri]|uniref:hypothetical protein n=1 Tax=Limosilactobacillus reuteri TaxID=1598 RepID=UPI000BC3CE1C|nr:hypothetical protein [Limosilactobacillus reuteri]OYS79548.1 hypothetical protein CBG04_11585 [Limosilactobacillus reuteri]